PRAAARPGAGRGPARAPRLGAAGAQVVLGRQAAGREAGTRDAAPKQGALGPDLRGAPGPPVVLASRLTDCSRHMATVQAMSAAATEKQQTLVIRPPSGIAGVGFRDLWRFRELLLFLTWRDIKVRYKQTLLGAAWAILQPF